MKSLIALILLLASLSATADTVSLTNPSASICTMTCNSVSTPTPTCSIVPNGATTITSGQSISLGSSCSPGASSYAWTGPGVNPSAGSQVVSPGTTSAYTLTGSNQYGPGNTASVVVTVNQPAPTDDCAAQGLSNTVIPLDWGGGRLNPFSIGPNQSISFVLQSPDYAVGGSLLTTYGDSEKIMSISTKKCDFDQALATKRCFSSASDPGLYYANIASYVACVLAPNTTYYVNIRNAVLINNTTPIRPIQDSCTAGTCNFSIRY